MSIKLPRRTLLSGALALTAGPALGATSPPVPDKPYLTVEELRARYGHPAGKLMNIGGVDIYYTDEGAGPAILMVHGSSSSLRTYDGMTERLKDRFRIIRYDVPPGGLSGPVSDSAAASLRPEDVPEALLTRLGVRAATVIGVSSGGTMGYFLAAKRPDLVSRLILSNTPADVVDTSKMRLSPALAHEQALAGEPSGPGFKRPQFWDAFLDFFWGDPSRVTPALRQEYYDMNRKTPQAHRFALWAVVANHPFTVQQAAKVTCPVLLLWGERDPLLPAPAADVLARYLHNADVSKLLLPDVGHYPPLEVPARYAEVTRAYIDATPTPTPA